MSRLEDEDGIDGPFERAIAASIRRDAAVARALRIATDRRNAVRTPRVVVIPAVSK